VGALLQDFGIHYYNCFKFPVLFAGGGGSGDDNPDPDDPDVGEDVDGSGNPDKQDKDDGGDKSVTKPSVDKDDPDNKPPDNKKSFDESYVKNLRAEAAKYRREKREEAKKVDKLDAQLKAIQKALGLEDQEPDAEQLEKELGGLKAQLKEERLHNRFMQAAITAEADPELTYAYLKYRGDLDDLDVDDDNFSKDLKGIIEGAMESNPKLKVGKEPPKKSGDNQSDDKGSKGGFSMNDLIRKAAGRT